MCVHVNLLAEICACAYTMGLAHICIHATRPKRSDIYTFPLNVVKAPIAHAYVDLLVLCTEVVFSRPLHLIRIRIRIQQFFARFKLIMLACSTGVDILLVCVRVLYAAAHTHMSVIGSRYERKCLHPTEIVSYRMHDCVPHVRATTDWAPSQWHALRAIIRISQRWVFSRIRLRLA